MSKELLGQLIDATVKRDNDAAKTAFSGYLTDKLASMISEADRRDDDKKDKFEDEYDSWFTEIKKSFKDGDDYDREDFSEAAFEVLDNDPKFNSLLDEDDDVEECKEKIVKELWKRCEDSK